jgi:hypothetical protein
MLSQAVGERSHLKDVLIISGDDAAAPLSAD